MSSSTGRRPDRRIAARPAAKLSPLAALRLLLAVAYPLLAHWASVDGSGVVALLALADLAVIVLLQPLAMRRGWAWLLLALVGAGLWSLHGSKVPALLLLAPPVVFTALLSWWFGRSLGAGRVPLISRIVSGLEGCEPPALKPELKHYTRRLTAIWTVLLAGLALTNGILALIAVPDGVLMRLGYPPVLAVSQDAWSWFANLLNYGIVGGFFLAEYIYRKRRFPDRPYRNFPEFMQRMAALGPGFWRTLFD
ncbi:MAG: ketosynthase [Lysobacter sp.]